MNEGQLKTLGRRARRCAGWKWMPGMLVFAPALRGAGEPETGPLYARLVSMGGLGIANAAGNERLIDCDSLRPETILMPDFRDPATLGWLLALVRDALNDPALCVVSYYVPDGRAHKVVWSVEPTDQQWQQKHKLFDFVSEAEALVAALEAAGGGE